jgi:UDP-N-acetylglucosamine 2-epimerase (non-hydrolysing)
LDALSALPIPVVLPLHPRTRARVEEFGLGNALDGLMVREPLGYGNFLALVAESALVIGDSGGLQEEVSVLKRPMIVIRRSTERPEVLGTFADLVPAGGPVREAAMDVLADLGPRLTRLAELDSPYGDGEASGRCCRLIAELALTES